MHRPSTDTDTGTDTDTHKPTDQVFFQRRLTRELRAADRYCSSWGRIVYSTTGVSFVERWSCVCMRLFVHIYGYIHTQIHAYARPSFHLSIHPFIHPSIHPSIMHACMHTYTHTHVRIYM